MAIFIASTKSITRSKGQSAVASASYRAGVELKDERYGKTHNYSKRYGVMSADIILPSSLHDKNLAVDRGELWNLAEKAEKRKDSRVAREWLVNLPYELDEEERKKLAHQFSQELADRYGVIADCAIHKPTQKEVERGADPRNFHAHIMLTTRKAELNNNNEIVLTEKSTAELSNKKRIELGLSRMSQEIKEVRRIWERVANEKLAEHNLNLIDSRSYKEQGIDIIPQIKMGVDATHMERRTGEKSHKGMINDIINERNELIFNRELKENELINERADQIIFESRKNNEREQTNDSLRAGIKRATKFFEITDKLIDNATKNTTFINKRVKRATQRINDTQQQLETAERTINSTARTATQRPNPFDEQYRASVNRRKQAIAELAEQERRVADETKRADTDARRNKYEDKRTAELAENVKLKIAGKLLRRNNDDSRLRWAWGETSEEYPDKYDKRQIALLDDFEKLIGFDSDIGFREKLTHISSMIDSDFIEQHKDMIQLINDPASERQQYNERLTSFVQFKEHIDNERAEFNDSIIEKLGGTGGEVGRMTRDIISSFSYMKALDTFINDETQTADARQLAEQHRADTLDKTCQQFKFSLQDVNKLNDSQQRESYTNALNSSLETFKQIYGSELSESQNKAIDDGVRSFNRDAQRMQSPSRGYSR